MLRYMNTFLLGAIVLFFGIVIACYCSVSSDGFLAGSSSGADWESLILRFAAGLWSGLRGRRAVLVWPAVFVAAAMLGFGCARTGMQIPFVDMSAGISEMLFGILVVLNIRIGLLMGAVIVAFVAFVFGVGHGIGASATDMLGYAAGFLVSTIVLLALGVLLSIALRGRHVVE